ncbi:hypothetical protein [Streptomyces sp. NPDC007905]|uniref:hypothetical protein n=1 Tax=Streptomyces sp. NPDC007905 TaxID=3364788 RepID=UPI0036EDB2E3
MEELLLSSLQKFVLGSAWDMVKEELKQLVEENRRLREYVDTRLEAQDRRVDEHDIRLDALSKARTQQRRLIPAEYLDHQDIRTKLNTLADQVLLDIAVRTAEIEGPRKEADVIGRIARLLFPEEGPSPDAETVAQQLLECGLRIPPDKLHRACELTREIRLAADATGHTIDWDFTLDLGEPLDPERQQPHAGCDAEGLADFVTVPGYSADGKAYVRQRVFTRPRLAETAQPGPAGALPPEQPATTETAAVLTVRVAFDMPEVGDKTGPGLLKELADLIGTARQDRAVRLSEATSRIPRKHIVLEDDGRPVCSMTAVASSGKVKVEIDGENDEVIGCAHLLHAELSGKGLQVCFKRVAPGPWGEWWSLPGEHELLRQHLLGEEPQG